ncbi:hypothetical protein CCACVL1_20941 [Corchorus capsularis]|uniref:Uncharacterized protein n=1 Tax=Corchorus capsularis TaxID=210143 RepID=A0A1R3H964_COCAP|nr:hypothetical protein CCACVL1_20941 [Corchorus capsularis]
MAPPATKKRDCPLSFVSFVSSSFSCSNFTLVPSAAANTNINDVPSAQQGSPAATGLQPNLLPKAEPYSTSESHINIPAAAAAALLPVNLSDIGGYGFSVNSSTPLDQVMHFSHPEKVTHILSQSGASATNLENSLNINNVTNSSQEGSSINSDSTSLAMESNILMDHFSYDFPYEFVNGSNYIWSSSQDQKAGEENIGGVPSCYDSLADFSHADNMKPQGLINQSVANQY